MIAVICSLLGVVLIGLILLLIIVKMKKRVRDNQRCDTQIQLGSSTSCQRNNSPQEAPPPYSSVVNAPPPYVSSSTMDGSGAAYTQST